MKFKLDMNEVTNLIRTHIETQYGRQTGSVHFIAETSKDFIVEVHDNGPMPKSTPAPDGMSMEDVLKSVEDDARLQKNLAGMRAPNNPDHDKD